MEKYLKCFKRVTSVVVCLLMLLNMLTFVCAAETTVVAKLYWSAEFDQAEWNDAESENAQPVFNIADLEPGSEVVRYFKVKNAGSLAFSYALKLASAEVGDLAEVIDVYCKSAVSTNTSIAEMGEPIGTLVDVINNSAFASGSILPMNLTGDGFYTNETVVAVGLKMHSNAAIKYQNASAGEFSVELTATECDFTYPEIDKFRKKFPNTDSYLYRVGNVNEVKLGSLFEAVEGASQPVGNVSVAVEKLDPDTDVDYTYTENADWTKFAIKFTGTGPVSVTISDDRWAKPVVLYLEVINATNVTSYGELKNTTNVLLNDITMSSNSSYYLSGGATLYGNGFTFDVTTGKHGDTTNGYIGGNYVVCLNNAHLDNVKIVGAVYTAYGATAKSDYNFPNILSKGNSTIKNSYISNCAAPVRVQDGVLEIKDTTLKGGNFANIDIREPKRVILDNVTTINQENSNDIAADGTKVVGLGVLVWYENVNTSIIEVRNGITQYNNLSESQAKNVKDSTVKNLINQMYGSSLSSIQYNDGTEKWVNTGILSTTNAVGENDIIGVDNFIGQSVSAYSVSGYVCTQKPDAESISKIAPIWEAEKQETIAPVVTFNHDKNKKEQVSGSNEFCYYNSDMGKVLVSFDDGGSKIYYLDILSAQKGGTELEYTIKVDGEPYSENSITFDQTKDYVVEYTYTDPYNYELDGNGNVVKTGVTYTKRLDISVTEVPKAAKNADFTFYGYSSISKTPAVTITDVKTVTSNSGKTYIMPATTDTYVSSKTIDGITVNCPKVYVDFKDNKTDKDFNWLYPVFLGLDIVDYKDGGAGDAETIVKHDTQASKPANLTIITEDKPSGGGGWSSGSGKSGSEGKLSSGTYKNLYGWTGGAIGSDQSANSIYGEFSYKDNKGTVYYYCIEFYREAHDCPSSCVTGDTLITLADGSTKRIDEITYDDNLLVWDFFNGEYAVTKPAIIFNHGSGNNTVIKLTFEDGTEVKVVNLHQFFDADENKFVNVSEDTVESLVGHNFVKVDGKSYMTVELTGYEISEEEVEAYGIITAQHYDLLAEGMLTTDFEIQDTGLFNYFEIGENLTFDAAKMEEDIAKYGLYEPTDFEGYLTAEQFEAFNVKYMKVAVGKGQFTYEGILGLIDKWLTPDDESNVEEIAIGEPEKVPADQIYEEEKTIIAVLTGNGVAGVSDEENSVTITLGGNTISSASYEISVSSDNTTLADGVYTCNADECLFTLSATGTATTGYAKITIGEDVYYTKQIASGESFVINFKNAKDKTVSVETFWGKSQDAGVNQEALIESGFEVEYTFAVEIKASNAELGEDGKYTCLTNESVFTLTANGTAASGYAVITVDGDAYYTQKIVPGEEFTVNVKNAMGKTVEIAVFCGDAETEDDLIESGATIDCGEVKIASLESIGNNIRAIISNTTKTDITGAVHIATYSKATGAMVDLKSDNITIPAKDKAYSPEVEDSDNYTIKVFLWKIGKMIPLVNSFFSE